MNDRRWIVYAVLAALALALAYKPARRQYRRRKILKRLREA